MSLSAPPPRLPGFFEHLWLLWGLRLRVALNAHPSRRAPAILAFAASCAPGIALGVGAHRLMTWGPVASSAVWPDFILGQLCFVTSAVLLAWPMLAAGVDDHSEVARYATLPVGGLRLMVASTLASLLEPRTLVLYSPLVGALSAYWEQRPPVSVVLALALCLAYVALNAAVSRAGLHVMLGVLRARQSAALVGGGLSLFVLGGALLPPVDTSWLWATGAAAVARLDETVLEDATRALGRVPSGFLSSGLRRLWAGDLLGGFERLFGLLSLTVISTVVAYGLLLDFQREARRGGGRRRTRVFNPFVRGRSVFGVLVARELLDLWSNPRARLLLAVPFLLGVVLKLFSARDLFVFLVGARADGVLLGTLCLYAAAGFTSAFAQNAFGYDGRGLALLFAAPVPLRTMVRAKAAAHALTALSLVVLVALFYRLYFGAGSAAEVARALLATTVVVPCLLAVGSFSSVYFPTCFHADLKRRDRVPLASNLLSLATTAVAALPFVWGVRAPHAGAGLWTLAAASGGAAIIWLGVSELALRHLGRRRDAVLAAVRAG